jgi:2-hydroxy-3-oxopropionate reductase
MIDSDFKPGFKLSLHHKDLKIAKAFLSNIGIQLKSLNQVKKLMNLAESEGLSDLDSSAIHSILEKTYK